jgi:hypothetical protein
MDTSLPAIWNYGLTIALNSSVPHTTILHCITYTIYDKRRFIHREYTMYIFASYKYVEYVLCFIIFSLTSNPLIVNDWPRACFVEDSWNASNSWRMSLFCRCNQYSFNNVMLWLPYSRDSTIRTNIFNVRCRILNSVSGEWDADKEQDKIT